MFLKSYAPRSNKIEAKKPCFVQIGGVTIGLMAFAEHEFNLAGKNVAGANGFDSFESFNEIKESKTKCDYLVILFHGGVEYHKYPSPLLQKRCRKMVLSGANLILCQHSHCIGAMETYKEGTIVYGQGNSVFGYKDNDVYRDLIFINSQSIETFIYGTTGVIKDSPSGVSLVLDDGFLFDNERNFISKCKKNEDDEGYIKPSFFDLKKNSKYQFSSGPFTNLVFRILDENKLSIKGLIGNFSVTVSKEQYFFRPE